MSAARDKAAFGLLRLVPLAALLVFGAPILLGLLGALGPAFNLFPAIEGADHLSLAPWVALAETPGIARSALLSLWTGLASAAIALFVTLLFFATLSGTRAERTLRRLVSPLLAAPHAAAALAFAYLIAPSGFLARLVSPWATGWERSPEPLLLEDPFALGMIAGLTLKEIPFLMLMSLAALPQLRAGARVQAARAMGYRPATAWAKTVLPGLYPLVRLPVYAVIAFATSTVDVARILGPDLPPTLAVRVLELNDDPDLTRRLVAAAAALLQLGVTLAALGLWRLGEWGVGRAARGWLVGGGRGGARGERGLAWLAGGATALMVGALALGLFGLLLESLAWRSRFPDAWPDPFTLRRWEMAAPRLWDLTATTLALALTSTAAALALAVALLEWESRRARSSHAGLTLWLYAPLIVPQATFLFGLAIGAERLGLRPGFWPVAAAHLVFVAPYVTLSLSESYRRFDPRYLAAARALGVGPWAAFWRVRAPMLLGPLLTAAAVGFAVSVGQYLPTRVIGAGRVETLTTEAVALSAGARGVVGVWAVAQALTPAIGFALALALPRLIWRNRRGLRESER